MMDETVTIMKRVWTEKSPVTHEGTFFRIENARVEPKPFQQPHPPFYLGGISEAAREVCAKHANVYLFWGDTPENIAARIAETKTVAAKYGREDELGYGMRLQVIVREREEDAWEFAHDLIKNASEYQRTVISRMWEQSESNSRMKELAKAEDFLIAPHLWSGISSVRPGAGVAIVGNPEQVAETIQQFIDIGCSEFCLSGYPHAEEAERFGRLVMPYFADRLAPGE
jgi:alkanesulfonate monooxygenase